ncbi:MAG TPA: hypothetical protein VHY91_01280 [Pirellulales bacterium]|nr:hypothetical protein [Pirellulales bacterium]
MNPQLRNLAWVELRERRMQWVVCLLWMVGSAVYCIASVFWGGTLFGDSNHISAQHLYVMLVPIFIAMRTSLGETTDHTRSFSDGLPISARLRAAVRLAGGASVLVVPILVATALLSLAFALGWFGQGNIRPPVADHPAGLPDRESMIALSVLAQLWFTAGVIAFSAVCFYLILSLLGTTLRAESHLGYWGVVLAVFWFVGYAMGQAVSWREQPELAASIGAITPQATLVGFNGAGQRPGAEPLWIYRAVFIPLCASAVVQFGLAALFVQRYSRRPTARTAERAEKKRRRIWWRLRLPLPTRGVALAWLALRESVPLCLPGLALACLLGVFSVDTTTIHYEYEEAVDTTELTPQQAAALQSALSGTDEVVMIEERLPVDYPGDASELPAQPPLETEEIPVEAGFVRGVPSPHRFKYLWQSYKDGLPSAMWFIGCLWAVVVGAGLFSSEIDWRVGEFWRTRPISAWSVFTVKFVFGLLAVLLVLDGTVIAAGWKSPQWGESHAMNWAYIACILPLHATLFAVAVAWTCVLRRAAIGAVAALLTFIAVEMVLGWFGASDFGPIEVANTWGFANHASAGGAERYPVLAAAMALITMASIVIGWRALRRYDPRRQTG